MKMQASNHIRTEVKQISELVASIGSENPYRVPAGYFESLPVIITNSVMEAESPAFLPARPDNPAAEVPENYFDRLADNIFQRIRLEGSAEDSETEEFELPSFLTLKKISTPYTLPENYFNELPAKVFEKKSGADDFELNPLFSDLSDKPIYRVPEGYFDNFHEKVLKAVQAPSKARVVRMNPRFQWRRYAVAAVITGLLFLGGFYYFGFESPQAPPELAAMDKISSDELESFLVNNPGPVVEMPATELYAEFSNEDFAEILSDVPEDVLKRYLLLYTEIDPETIN